MTAIFRRLVNMTDYAKARPVVAVIGTTGVGKSDLAIALAESLRSQKHATTNESTGAGRDRYQDGVVLSADSMQIYKGLDVITNKITKEEMRGIRHWGMDMVKPGEGNWEMGKWCIEAEREMSRLPAGTLPIVCGGTHYFIQHFLFPPAELSFDRPESISDAPATQGGSSKRWFPPQPRPDIPTDLDPELEKLLETFWTDTPVWPSSMADDNDNEAGPSRPTYKAGYETDSQLLALHQLLVAVDPKEAGRWHWRDGRKVRRGLERWWETSGCQRQKSSGSGTEARGRKARFRTLVFWVYEPLESLRPRLSRRVDKMVDRGLLREIAELRAIAKELYGSADEADHTEGIFQAIGYKEFAGLDLDQDDTATDPAFESMLERMKLSTHQYARSQIKWIRKQLLPAIKEARSLGGQVEVYAVRGGLEGHQPSIDLLHKFLSEGPMPPAQEVGHPDAHDLLAEVYIQNDHLIPDTAERQNINQRKDCEICSSPGRPYSVSLKEWDIHAKSKIHKVRQNLLKAGGKEAWIEQQRAKGEQKRAERDAAKGEGEDVGTGN